MDEKDIISTVDSSLETTPQSSNIVDRILQESMTNDFGVSKTKTIGDIAKEYDMRMTPFDADRIVEKAGLYTSVGDQTAAAVKNVLVDLSGLGDKVRLSYGNTVNMFSGGKIGEEMQNIAFDNLGKLYEDMAYREKNVGGITSNLAQLAAGVVSFAELAVVGLATAGYGSLAQIAAQTMGEGAYNDMQAYIDEHGSLEGYRPEGADFALNVLNTIFQVGSEAILGVGSPRFFTGWSRGLWKEGVSGFVQEGLQGYVSDLFEVAKGNKEYEYILDNADQYLRDAIIGGFLQGALGAATYGTKRARADSILASMIAQSRGRKTPNKEDQKAAKDINDAKERMYTSTFAEEFKKTFDATSEGGQLQQKIATAINDAYKAGKIDFGGASETQIAQKIESFAAQETLNAMEDSAERKQSIGEHELNSIVFKGAVGAKEGEVWLAGLEPEVGERSVDLAKVLEYRQSGLAEINAELEVLDGEIKQLRKQLAETTVDVKEAQKELLKEQIKKKEGQAESKRLKKTQLEASNARLYASIEKMSAPKAEKAIEQKSLKSEREQEKAVKEQRKQAREKKPATAKKEGTKLKTTPTVISNGTVSFKVNLVDEQQNGDFESWTGKTNIEISDEKIKQILLPIYEKLKTLSAEDGIIVETPENQDKIKEIIKNTNWNTIVTSLMRKYDLDADVVNWLYNMPPSRFLTNDEDNYENNLEAMIALLVREDEFVGGVSEVPLYDYLDQSDYYSGREQELIEKYNNSIYVLPNDIVDAEKKILNYIGNQYMEAVDYDTGKADVLPDNWFSVKPEQEYMLQSRPDQSRLDKGDTYRGAYDEKLKRIILNEKSDLTTIQHEFAHYWIQNNFRWYRSGLASDDWKRNWERVEQALGIEPTDKYLSKVASEKFARAYERYIMEGKVAPEYQWAFAEFQEFYNEVYEDLKAEYFDLNEELSPELIDWFNRQRPVAPEQVAEMTKKQVYQGVADFATKLDEQPAEEISDGVYIASEPNNEGGVEEEVFVETGKARKSKLAVYRETTSESNITKRLREKNPNLTADKYANLNRAETVEQAIDWVTRDFDSAWQAFIDPKTNVKDRAALFIALERESANNPQLAIDLLEYRNEATELGQAVSILAERPQISTVEILALEQEALGKATDEQIAKEINDSDVNGAVSEDRIKQLKELTECVL